MREIDIARERIARLQVENADKERRIKTLEAENFSFKETCAGLKALLKRIFTSYGGEGIVKSPQDHGCPKCWPGGEMVNESFLCPYHEGLAAIGDRSSAV